MLCLIAPIVAILIAGTGLVPGHLDPAAASQASPAASPTAGCPTTTLEENKALVRRYFAAHNERKPVVAADLLSDDFVRHNVAFPQLDQASGTADDVDCVAAWLAMFPDLQISIKTLIAEGDLVTAYLVWHGTQDGPIPQWDAPATGHRMEREAINIWRVACGRLAEAGWWRTT